MLYINRHLQLINVLAVEGMIGRGFFDLLTLLPEAVNDLLEEAGVGRLRVEEIPLVGDEFGSGGS